MILKYSKDYMKIFETFWRFKSITRLEHGIFVILLKTYPMQHFDIISPIFSKRTSASIRRTAGTIRHFFGDLHIHSRSFSEQLSCTNWSSHLHGIPIGCQSDEWRWRSHVYLWRQTFRHGSVFHWVSEPIFPSICYEVPSALQWHQMQERVPVGLRIANQVEYTL